MTTPDKDKTPVDAGIDYGLGRTNVDKKTGIRYGVINQNELIQSWADESEADYGEPHCPTCGNELTETSTLLSDDNAWLSSTDGSEISEDWVCESCDKGVDENDEEIYSDEPLNHYYDKDGIMATQDSDGDIFVCLSPYYTKCQLCSPCAPGAGYIMSQNDDGIKAYCFGHDWFEEKETDKWINCKYCEGTGLRKKTDFDESIHANFTTFDDSRFLCPGCSSNIIYGHQGQVKESFPTAPYKVYSVETDEEVTIQ